MLCYAACPVAGLEPEFQPLHWHSAIITTVAMKAGNNEMKSCWARAVSIVVHWLENALKYVPRRSTRPALFSGIKFLALQNGGNPLLYRGEMHKW